MNFLSTDWGVGKDSTIDRLGNSKVNQVKADIKMTQFISQD